MTTEVIVSIVVGTSGLVVGVIAWFQAVRVARLNADANRKLEELRTSSAIEIERLKIDSVAQLESIKNIHVARSSAYEKASVEAAPHEASIDQSWQHIQLAKESIGKLSFLDEGTPKFRKCLQELETLHEKIANAYRALGPIMDGLDMYVLHHARDCVGGFVDYFKPSFPDEVRKELPLPEFIAETRESLTDHQIRLLRARENLRLARTESILKALTD